MKNDPSGPRVCTACSCLCDDIDLAEETGRLRARSGACHLGAAWLEARPPLGIRWVFPDALPIPEPKVARVAAERLAAANAPIVVLTEAVTMEATRLSIAIAERLRATLVAIPAESEGPARSGLFAPEMTRSLGEVRACAELVLFWGCDPERTHPRWIERYAPDTVLENGTTRRRVGFLAAHRGQDIAQLDALRRHLERREPAQSLPLPHRTLAEQIGRVRAAHIVLGSDAAADPVLWDGLQTLAARTIDRVRLSISTLGAPGNARGVRESVLWQSGVQAPVDFSARPPRSLPYPSLEAILEGNGVDLVFCVGPSGESPREALEPRFPRAKWLSLETPGLDPRLRGRVMRSDGIVLWLCGEPSTGVADPTVRALERVVAHLPVAAPGAADAGSAP